ncbi:hypothetical protein BDF19DRAFT_421037 [Syncephalis fuscata]|nr:hypothetical protein BDF19DRAFT_421037 [Syncephalis fuscata]
MGLIDRIKSSYFYTNWKVGRYTKRRRALVSEFDQKPAEFYERYYCDGEYLHQEIQRKHMSYDIQLHSKTTKFPRQTSESSASNNGCSWRFGDDDDEDSYGLPATPKSWETIPDDTPRLAIENGPTTPSVEASGYYRGSMYGVPGERKNAMVQYNSPTASKYVHGDDIAIQRKMDAEYQQRQDATGRTGRGRQRMTLAASEIRCSEMYNMSWL